LRAYIVPTGAAEIGAAELRSFLAEVLPYYMIPGFFVGLVSLPLTANGKLDKAALPEPGPENALPQVGFRAPNSPTERRLAGIVAASLQTERIGADDDFFLFGGHSLLATQAVLRARDEFGIDLSLLHLFEAQTVANLAVTVEQLLMEKLATMSETDAQRLLAG
jgi:acyl carrier protein